MISKELFSLFTENIYGELLNLVIRYERVTYVKIPRTCKCNITLHLAAVSYIFLSNSYNNLSGFISRTCALLSYTLMCSELCLRNASIRTVCTNSSVGIVAVQKINCTFGALR
jgi:hypothetical protein